MYEENEQPEQDENRNESEDVPGDFPAYRCHKIVRAVKVKAIKQVGDARWVIYPDEEDFGPFKVNAEYFNKHQPRVGGYYVVYKDGYSSWSPAEAFEEGYTRIE